MGKVIISSVIFISFVCISCVSAEIINIPGDYSAIQDGINAGVYRVNWDASAVSSGLYFYRLSAGEQILTKRMLLLK
ncbi:MAG: hypothetical protein GF307_04230 [candidate division Zixibacteria bacterium]|nr:hypothetical protein [candidate division Zixibacteria bacterium]